MLLHSEHYNNKILSYKTLIANTKEILPLPEIIEDTINTMIYTYGTTENPMGVVLSH